MKRIYSFMVATVALVASAACTQELDNAAPEKIGETVVYTASVDGASTPDAKAALNSAGTKSEWAAGDAITVVAENGSWDFTADKAGEHSDFSNTGDFGNYRPVMAVYPAAYDNRTYVANIAEKTVTAYIPTWQQAQIGTYQANAAVAVAYSETNSFAFKNATALLKFTVATDNVTHVIFHGNDSEAITGNVTITLGQDGVSDVKCEKTEFNEQQWNEELQKDEDVTVSKYGTWVECYAYHDENNKYFVKGETYYIAVAPQVFTGGVTAKIRINEGEEIVVKTTSEKVETTANTILNIKELKYEAPVVHEWAIAGTFNGWNATANPMTKEGDYYVYKGVTGLHYSDPNPGESGSSTGIKFVVNGTDWKASEGMVTAGSWAYVWDKDAGSNIYVEGATAEAEYDIYVNPSEGDNGKFVIVPTGQTMPEDKPVEEEVQVDYWAVVGSMTDSWGSEKKMTLDGDWYVIEGVEIRTTDQFKFRADGDSNWTINRGAEGNEDGFVIVGETNAIQGGKNFAVGADGVYRLSINKSATKVKAENTADLPEIPEWSIAGAFNSWNVTSTPLVKTGDYYVVKKVKLSGGFKILKKGDWLGGPEVKTGKWTAFGGGDITVTGTSADAEYDVYVNPASDMFVVVVTGDAMPEPGAIYAESGWVYLKPNSNWTQANARFAIYFFGNGGNEWLSMEPIEETSYYGADISTYVAKGYTNLIFCRMNPKSTTNGWTKDEQLWNQTGDLEIPSDSKNAYSINVGQWDSGQNGSWSTVTRLN